MQRSITTLTIISRSLEDPHALLDCGARVPFIIWWVDSWEQCDIYSERLVGQGASLADGRAQGSGIGLG
jgi:hypothetical protein